MNKFTHLHVHSHYSLLEGLVKVDQLINRAKELEFTSLALTDNGALYGIPEFWKLAKGNEIKPIVGCEVYVAPSNYDLKREVDGIKYYTLVLIAKNQKGYINLVKLITEAHINGYYYKPRVDLELLSRHSEGLICLSGSQISPINKHIVRNELDKTEGFVKQLKQIYSNDFYLEIIRNGLLPNDQINQALIDTLPKLEAEDQLEFLQKQQKVNQTLYEISKKFEVPMVATANTYYLEDSDKDVQKVLFAIKDGRTLNDPLVRNGYIEASLKSYDKMLEHFSDMPELLEQSVKIDEQIEYVSLKFDRVQPRYWNLPKNTTAKEELDRQVWEGAKKMYPEMTDELKKRLEYELMVIDKMGYNDYFLVVGDIMQFARKKGIIVGVRGSAAGSAASYCLGITNVDPIKWELYFERFLNLERMSPPDIDMDIQDDRREELIDYVREKYGQTNVAGIVTFGKLATKAAIRDVARVMGIDLAIADKLSKKVIVLFGKPYSFQKMMEEDPEFKEMVDNDQDLQLLGEYVKKIEGLNRHTGVHAAGYLITPEPINEYVAFQKDTKDPKLFVTQIDGTWVDKLDFMKFDFLGLRTLSILKNTLDYIEKSRGKKIDILDIPNDDKATFELFGRGETVGVFQFESPPMQQYLRELQPQNQEDICFLAAAYRPGPMKFIPDYILCKHNEKQAEYLIPELEPVLNTTFGFPIYQEQLLKICMEFGGFTLGEGDVIRNALKKKNLEILQQKEPDFTKYFIEHFPQHGEEKARELWAQLKPFSDYGFNKAHSASYAVIAYWCAYLKAHYPLEFITALMHADLENTDRVIININEAKRLGFNVLQPSINKSDVYFTNEGEKGIRFGLGAIKNVGTGVCEKIIAERDKNGEFANLDDFIFRVGSQNLNKRTIECLIQAGALDEFGDRKAMLAVYEKVIDKALNHAKAESIGQTGLFNILDSNDNILIEKTELPEMTPTTERQKLDWEKELMGVYLSVHPLDKFEWTDLTKKFHTIFEIIQKPNRSFVKAVGIFEGIRLVRTKTKNELMAVVNFVDKNNKIDAVIFPKTFEQYNKLGLIAELKPIIIEGIINIKDDQKSLIIEKIETAQSLIKQKKIVIDIMDVSDKDELAELRQCFVVDGDLEVEIIYGEKHDPKKITRKINSTNSTYNKIIKKYIVS